MLVMLLKGSTPFRNEEWRKRFQSSQETTVFSNKFSASGIILEADAVNINMEYN